MGQSAQRCRRECNRGQSPPGQIGRRGGSRALKNITRRRLMKSERGAKWVVGAIGMFMSVVSPNVRGQIKAARPVYLEPGQPIETRIDDLLSRMTLEEKISIIHGDSKFTTA